MPLPQQQPVTIEAYEALPEDARAEVFEGRIQYMSSPSQTHQTILMELSSALHSYVKDKKGPCKVLPAPFDVKLNDNPLTIVQPDIMIVCDKNKLDGKRCNGAPDFIIEIVSPGNSSDDYVKKLYYYKNYDVREYWIVDPGRRTISVNYFEKDMVSVPYTFSSTVKVNIYEDLFIDFREIEQLINL
ncbi:Uma2 family endonuclease [Lachnospiraceae bacterium 54-53]